MKITNKKGYPEPLVKALESKPYVPRPNRYSATALLAPASQTVLKRRHNHELSADVSDQVWALWGSGIHKFIEDHACEGYESEKRLETKLYVSPLCGEVTISGIMDLYDTKTQTIYDWKTTSVWKVKSGEFEDYYKQLCIYAWLMIRNGFPVKKIAVVMFLRDFSKTKAKFEKDYPQDEIVQIEWDFNEALIPKIEKYLRRRIFHIKLAELKPDRFLIPCSKKDRWHEDDIWRVVKKGNTKALKRCSSKEEAEEYLKTYLSKKSNKDKKEKDFEIVFKPGQDKRCEAYCSVRKWCPLWTA